MQNFCLMLARFCVAAWIGAAVLFVVTGVREVTIKHESISSEVKDALVPIRFPAYYVAGFLLVGTGIVTSGFACKHPDTTTKRMKVCLGLLILALIVMIADYVCVYLPLVEMITPAGGVKPANFQSYHKASMYINTLDVGLCLVAGILLCLPGRNGK